MRTSPFKENGRPNRFQRQFSTTPVNNQPPAAKMKTKWNNMKTCTPGSFRHRVRLSLIVLAGLALAVSGLAQTTNVWTDNFESPSVWSSWSVDNGVWEIGNPATGPATNSAGYRTHEGTNCAATILAGNYPAGTSSRLIRSLPFVVPAANQNPRLQFWHWYQFSGNSYGVVQIKYGTNNWADLSPRYYNTGSRVWTRPVVDLKAYAGKAVQIAFQIAADAYVADGWCVDEVRFVAGAVQTLTANVPEGFEIGLGDWSANTGTWEVGVATYGPPTNALGRRAYAGTNCATTVLGGNYDALVDSRLISPPFVVPVADQSPRLRFWHWFVTQLNADLCQVQIREPGSNWVTLATYDFMTSGSGNYTLDGIWTRPLLDLAAYAGKTVELAFRLTSDACCGQYAGWYLDEVMVETGPRVVTWPEGFEGGWGGWYADNGQWEVGVPTYGPPTNALGRRAYAGTNCAATVLSGNYGTYADSRLISPPFVVPVADQSPRLRFWHWFVTQLNADLCQVQIREPGSNWVTLATYDFMTSGSGNYTLDGIWTRPLLDLAAYAGKTVELAFRLTSDACCGQYAGWYLDEVMVETGPRVVTWPEGFEGGWGGWYADNGQWEVGVPTYGPPTNALGRRAYAGTNCAATVLSGNYGTYADSRLISPPFRIPSLGEHPMLRFWHWFLTQQNVDWLYVEVREVGSTTWSSLATYTGSSGVWTSPALDLSPYAGTTVELAFRIISDPCCTQYAGWYIDEIVVTSVSPPTGIVEFTDARYFVNEGETTATISMERKYGGAGAVDVTFVATDGTGIGGVDFDSVVDTLSWADGEQGVKTDIVPIHQNGSVRGNKTVTLQLLVPGSVASSVARENSTLVILDNCLPPLTTTTNIAYLRSLMDTTSYAPTNTMWLFTVDGTVTTYTNLSSAPADELFFMQDNTSGIAVLFRNGTNQFMPQSGDRVQVTAALTNINGLLALAPDYNNLTNVVWRLSASNSLPTPAALDFATRTNVSVTEATEARYMVATNVWVSQSGGAYFPTVLSNILVTNVAGRTFDLTIHPNLTIAGKAKPIGPVNILGVLTQNDPTSPYTTNYSLLPMEIQGGDMGVIQFTVNSIKVVESAPLITLSVTRTIASNGPVSVTFGAVHGSAVAGTDFVATNGTLSWVDGETVTKSFTVQLLNDSVEEPDKVFTVGLTGIALGSNATVQVTIVNDDFVARPPYQAVAQGATVSLNITPTANSTFYQWWKDGAVKPNATNATLTLSNVQLSDQTNYWAVVTTTAGVVISSVAQVIIAVPAGITTQPVSQTVQAGSSVTFTVGVFGTPPFSYQWLRNGTALGGGTNSSFVMGSAQTSDSGGYSVMVNNAANVPTNSAVATLAVFGGGFVPRGAGVGDYTVSNGCYVAWGSGEDIEGTEDRFFFLNTEWSGDGEVITQMSGLMPDNPLSEAGVMLRDGFAGGDRHVFLALNAQNQAIFRRRAVANYSSVQNVAVVTNVAWLRLARMGDTFTGHYSTNGFNWVLLWWTTVPNMPTNLMAGLAVTAHRNTGLATNVFCNVSVGGLLPLSGPWPSVQPRVLLGGEPDAYPRLSSLGGFKVLIGGSVGDRYQIRSSASAALPWSAWSVLGTATNQYGVVSFLDPSALGKGMQFYRAQKLTP